MLLKDGSHVQDHRLDRVIEFDERSRDFTVDHGSPKTVQWYCPEHLDQGREGACVGFGLTHSLLAKPIKLKNLKSDFALLLYHKAQRIDRYPGGSYEGAIPKSSGTSIIAGAKILKDNEYIDRYYWGFGMDDLIIGLNKACACLGISWYSSMYHPKDGFIEVKGKCVGGHCILCKGVNIEEEYFILHNSWGTDYGVGGDCYIRFSDMSRLLGISGECCFLHRKKSWFEKFFSLFH